MMSTGETERQRDRETERMSAPPSPHLPPSLHLPSAGSRSRLSISAAQECGIALGSNAGDRLANLRAAVAALREIDPQVEVSQVYETAPVDCPDGSGAFLNAVAILSWTGAPVSLLHFLRGIECRLGRPTVRTRNAPRSMDLDIIYAGDAVAASDELTLPHPRLRERRFVLQPLCDLRPALVLPGFDRPVRQLLDALPDEAVPPVRLNFSLQPLSASP